MTSHAYKRCIHCRTVYLFQSSGPGCGSNYNDGRYCPDCAKAIAEVLKKIPYKFEQVWGKTEEIDAETLMAVDRALDAKADLDGKLRLKRVGCPLFDMGDLTNSHNCIFIRYEGKEYRVDTWSKTPESNTVKVAMERNLQTGEMKLWREL